MSNSISPQAPAADRPARGGTPPTLTKHTGNLRTRIRWVAVLPAVATTLLGVGAVAWVLVESAVPVPRNTVLALVVAWAACLGVLGVAFLRAERIGRAADHAIDTVRNVTVHGQAELQRLLEQVRRGELPPLGPPPALPVAGDDRIALLRDAVHRAQYAARTAVVQAAAQAAAAQAAAAQAAARAAVASSAPPTSPAATGQSAADAQVEVFVNLARRLQSLVHRTIQLLDDLENQVEDPDLLMGLFQADHLVTRMRRHAENLAVLGGADSRRVWTTPQALTEVLRSAIAEVEQYSRVKLVPPIEGTLHGHAVSDVVHLIAELVENATMFSPPHTLVLLRVQTVTAGLVVEVEDRGLGISREDQLRVNSLLADPQRTDVQALLRDGRLGLYVVSVLARRHGVAVQLQSNIFGGTQAIVIVPHTLLGVWQPEREAPQQVVAEQPASALPASPSAPVSSPTSLAGPAVPPPPAAAGPTTGTATVAERSARPPLPQRVSQRHLAPQLQQPVEALPDDPAGEHDPSLITAFREGFGTAEAAPLDTGRTQSHQDHIS